MYEERTGNRTIGETQRCCRRVGLLPTLAALYKKINLTRALDRSSEWALLGTLREGAVESSYMRP